MEQIKEKMNELETFKNKVRKIRSRACKNYYDSHTDKMREYYRIKSKEYYDKNKSDPEFRKKKYQNTLKSLQKKKEQEELTKDTEIKQH
jgi:hypothetical protein